MEGKPVTIRFLDPPLHEFVPTDEKDIEALAKDMNLSVEEVKSTCSELHEFNPMMGHRGCRLSVTYPEIARMQTRAVIEAAIEVSKEKGFEIVPEIMVPLVGDKKELKFVKDVIVETAEKVKAEKNFESGLSHWNDDRNSKSSTSGKRNCRRSRIFLLWYK